MQLKNQNGSPGEKKEKRGKRGKKGGVDTGGGGYTPGGYTTGITVFPEIYNHSELSGKIGLTGLIFTD